MSLKPKRVDFDKIWGEIKETVRGVITLSYVPKATWNDRFTDVYSLCIAHPEPFGDRLYEETKNFLNDHVKSLRLLVQENGEENLLTAYHKNWLQYSQGASYLQNLYLYLNIHHIKKNKVSDADLAYGTHGTDPTNQMLEIGELALEIWKAEMIEPLRDSLIKLLLEAIQLDRAGDSPNQSTIHGVIHSFVNVEDYKRRDSSELYEKIFEDRFLEVTGEYYTFEASKLLQENDVSSYLEKVMGRLLEENLRSRKFLHPCSYTKVTKVCVHKMVSDHLTFLYNESKLMVQEERRNDLQNLYRLLQHVYGLQPLALAVQDHIKSKGINAISSLKGDNVPALFVENILEVHRQYHNMMQEVFSGDQLFVGALDRACASVINHRPSSRQPCRSPELLAKYCDTLLKKSTKGITECEIDDRLAQSIVVFKYIDDKDTFQKFYSKNLAKRLIHQQSLSMDAEEAMINRLKQACGYEFTNKLHRMFTDMSLSADLNNKYSSYLKSDNIDLGVNFSVNVLQAGAWPLSQNVLSPFALPQVLEKSVQIFEKFYYSSFNGRRLTWLHYLCTAEIKLNYLKKPYIITMQTYQMAILLMFESVDTLTCGELQEHTQLSWDQLSKCVQSLLDVKLISHSDEVLGKETVLDLNCAYANKRTKFRIAVAAQRETQQEVEQTHASVDEDRKIYLQAAIVRIMKARKVIKHNSLIQEVITQCKNRFAPPINMIKKSIEALIDKQYLERTPNSTDEYSYVA